MYVTARQATRRHDMCDNNIPIITNSFDDFAIRISKFYISDSTEHKKVLKTRKG